MQGYLALQAFVQGNLVLHQKQIVQIVKVQSIHKVSNSGLDLMKLKSKPKMEEKRFSICLLALRIYQQAIEITPRSSS